MSKSISKEELVFINIKTAREMLESAHRLNECPLCREDIELVLNATKDLEIIASWAKDLSDHPHKLNSIRKLAINLDKLHLLSVLVLLYRNPYIKRLLLSLTRDRS